MAETYDGSNVAALLVLCFMNATDDAEPYKDFDDQLAGSKKLGTTQSYTRAMNAIDGLMKDPAKRKLVDSAHFAIRDLLEELARTEEWGNCRLISPEHIRKIVKLT